MRKPRHERLAIAQNGLLLPAVVTSISPIEVQIHGSDTSNSPATLATNTVLAVGTNVWVTRAGSKLVIMGLRENTTNATQPATGIAYFEEFIFNAGAITSSSFAAIGANDGHLTAGKLIGTSAFSTTTGVWTCPQNGIYGIKISWAGSVSAGSAVRCTTTILDGTTGLAIASDSKTTAGYPGASVAFEGYLPASEAIHTYIYYASGGQNFEAGPRYTFRLLEAITL